MICFFFCNYLHPKISRTRYNCWWATN
uniref:Uncharacterized protein n=1 Tax=Anguilla anguilla TaxID=7936 RepID=A0A0E9W3C3_ANGAN